MKNKKYDLIFFEKKYVIQEKTTEYVIRVYKPWQKSQAIKYYNFLNSGGAFNGFTPGFIVR